MSVSTPVVKSEPKVFNSHYRGEIVKVDETIKNGVYYVRVHPMFTNLADDLLPPATSELTNERMHIQLYKGDLVWVTFDNGDLRFPIIVGLINFKGGYPEPKIGTYGKYSKFKFGDKIDMEFDEDKGQVTINMDKAKIEVLSNSEVKITSDQVVVDLADNKIKINNMLVDLKLDILTKYCDILNSMLSGGLNACGMPVMPINPQILLDLIKLSSVSIPGLMK